jgi:hypothetical protein
MSNRSADNIKYILKKCGAAIRTAFIWLKTRVQWRVLQWRIHVNTVLNRRVFRSEEFLENINNYEY